jgi:hypothetical protein
MSKFDKVDYSNDNFDTTYGYNAMGERCTFVRQSSLYTFVGPEKGVAIHCDDGESNSRALASP